MQDKMQFPRGSVTFMTKRGSDQIMQRGWVNYWEGGDRSHLDGWGFRLTFFFSSSAGWWERFHAVHLAFLVCVVLGFVVCS